MSELSANDMSILERCFNPTGSSCFASVFPSFTIVKGLPFLSQEAAIDTSQTPVYDDIDDDALLRARHAEAAAVEHAENDRLDAALAALDALIEELPTYDSAYNNRYVFRRFQAIC